MLFNFFINDLIEECINSGLGAKVYEIIMNILGFCDDDLTTILPAYHYGFDSSNVVISDGSSYPRTARLRVDIKIPYIPAGQVKTIYVLYFEESTVSNIFNGTFKNILSLKDGTTNKTETNYCYDYIRPLSLDNHICYPCRQNFQITTMTETMNNANNNFNPDSPSVDKFEIIDNLDVILYNEYVDNTYPFFIVDGNSKMLKPYYNGVVYQHTYNNIVINDKAMVSLFIKFDEKIELPLDISGQIFQFTRDQNNDVIKVLIKNLFALQFSCNFC
jgi:hypothetical protein